jgi:type II secretory pathway pseudopilin PulG
MNPPPVYRQAPPASGKAITALVFGILTYVCAGPFAAIFAVIFGHLALSAIGRSGGTLGGRGMAIAGLVMGYVGFVITIPILLAIALPAIMGAGDAAKSTQALAECQRIVAAVQSYNVEYGRYPDIGKPGSASDTTVWSDNDKLFNILRAIPLGLNADDVNNPRKIQFFEGKTSTTTPAKNGFGADRVLYDPWGDPYHIRISTGGDSHLDDPYGGEPIQGSVIVWSYGRDRKPGRNGDGRAQFDITSWTPKP